jgi:phospholipid/cholesterol/gamma-HCH transport system permease protein
MTSAEGRNCWLDQSDDETRLHLAGAWELAGLHERQAELEALGRLPPTAFVIDGSALQSIDTAAALLVLRHLSPPRASGRIALHGFDALHRRIVELVRSRLDATEPLAAPRRWRALARIGLWFAELGQLLIGHVSFFGLAMSELSRVALKPRLLRVRELAAQLQQTGLSAVPVVALVTFLIGMVIAYLLGLQAEQYGANIFVVDGVSLGLTREFSPLLVATIVAGRSGAAFTAQLGTMKLTEEIDAIRTLGLSPEQVLIVPRILALVVALPALVFVGNVFGLAGAMVVADAMLDITPTTFIERLHSALAPRHYVIGLAKAPVFALAIAVIGCRMGTSVERDTRSIGINTTSTVVQSIVAVILLDALFAVLLQALGL